MKKAVFLGRMSREVLELHVVTENLMTKITMQIKD